MLWQIASNASLRLNALAQDGNANGDAEEILNPDYQSVNGDLKSIGRGGFNGFQSKYRFYTATLDIDLGWAHLLSLSGYNTTNYVANLDLTNVFGPIFGTPPFVLYPLAQDDRTNKFSQEIRLTSPSNQPLEWIGGLYYTREHTSFRSNPYGHRYDDGPAVRGIPHRRAVGAAGKSAHGFPRLCRLCDADLPFLPSSTSRRADAIPARPPTSPIQAQPGSSPARRRRRAARRTTRRPSWLPAATTSRPTRWLTCAWLRDSVPAAATVCCPACRPPTGRTRPSTTSSDTRGPTSTGGSSSRRRCSISTGPTSS